MRRFLCLYLPRWPLQRLLTEKSSDRNEKKPLALFERNARGPRVVVCSPKADNFGVAPGMSRADATALAPDLEFHEVDRNADRQALEELALWASQFTPLTGLENPLPGEHPEALLLDITGCAQVFGGEKSLLKLALQRLARKTLAARAAIAPTVGAAWALAHFGEKKSFIFNDSPSNSLAQTLSPLPLAALRPEMETLEWLNKLGVNRIGEILNQPRSSLPSRFGEQVLKRLDQALGNVSEKMPLLRPPPEFHASMAFEYPIRNLDLLQAVAEKLLERLCNEMRTCGRGARELECWLYHEAAAPQPLDVTLHKPSASPAHLLQLLKTRFEDFFSSQNGRQKAESRKQKKDAENSVKMEADDGVCAVCLRVNASEQLEAEQLALFHQALRAPERLALTLDRLSTRLGPKSVWRVELTDEAQPEYAFALVEHLESGSVAMGKPLHVADAPRPLCLFAQPQPIKVDWPEQCDCPRSIELRSEKLAVNDVSACERVETGWWREAYTRRDYFQIDCSDGARYWVFKNLEEGTWFLQGEFS